MMKSRLALAFGLALLFGGSTWVDDGFKRGLLNFCIVFAAIPLADYLGRLRMGLEDLPWAPRSRQMEGRQTEKRLAKKRGARVHPNSGAGKIKDDASTEDEVLEYKDANTSHTIKAKDLEALWRRATRQGKEAKYVIKFNNNIVAEVTVTKE